MQRLRSSRSWSDLLSNVVLFVSLGLAIAAWAGRFKRLDSPPAPVEIVGDWARFVPLGNTVGDASATLHVIVFGDYQCPACKAFETSLETVKKSLGSTLAITYVNYPLAYHTFAVPAANAADCAAAQGEFLSMHRALFASQDSLGKIQMLDLARRIGIPNLRSFAECMLEAQRNSRNRQPAEAVATLQITGTPTVIADGKLVRGAAPPAHLQRLLVDRN